MRILLGFLKQRWLISLAGILAVLYLIWYYGPLLTFSGDEPLASPQSRWLVMGVIFLLWAVFYGWGFWQEKQKNSQVLADLKMMSQGGGSSDDQASREELALLQERMSEALEVLQKTRLGRNEKQYLYQMPWYMLIGPPGSGKTTLLTHSGLRFPLAEERGSQSIGGVGGTRNCDWWFSEDAVLLDTAGRYTTQDSNEMVDRSAWLGFLDILKKHRPRRALNGVIVIISLSDLLNFNESERLLHVNAIRSRVSELYDKFNIRLPVYLIFNKCDVLPGFMDYFSDLDRAGREQVWGTTFSNIEGDNSTNLEGFDAEFEQLQQRLNEALIRKLDEERGREKRSLIYAFPQQFSTIREAVGVFVNELFQSSQYQQMSMVRGIYFTSATQDGSSIDRILGAMAGSFGVGRNELVGGSGRGKSFFVNNLLTKVIFPESGLTGSNQRLEKQRTWMQWGAIAASVLLALGVASLWLVSYSTNQSYLAESSGSVSELELLIKENVKQQNLLTVLPILDKAKSLSIEHYQQAELHGWGMHFGLYQGGRVGGVGSNLYHSVLEHYLMPQILSRLENRIKNSYDNSDTLYQRLMVYLMLDDAEHYRSTALKAWVAADWQQNLPSSVTAGQRAKLVSHLDILADQHTAPSIKPLNAAIVRQARRVLLRMPLAKRAYQSLKQSVQGDIDDFSISQAAGRDAPLVLVRNSAKPLTAGIPALFTKLGYKKWVLAEIGKTGQRSMDEQWVLGKQSRIQTDSVALENLKADVLKLYFQEYSRHWKALLADVRVVSFADLGEALRVLSILSGEESPLKRFYRAAAFEVDLDDALKSQESEDKESKIEKAVSLIPLNSEVALLEKRYVTDKFDDLFRFVLENQGQESQLDGVLAQLNELYTVLSPLEDEGGVGDMVLDQRRQVSRVLQQIKIQGGRFPKAIKQVLLATSGEVGDIVGGDVCKHLNRVWQTEVVDFYNQAIRNRYPLNKKSPRDITQDDFGIFFGPGGKIDDFFNKYLTSHVDRSRGQWRWIRQGSSKSCLSRANLRQLKWADRIKKAFFSSGGLSPSTHFYIKPVFMDKRIRRVDLNIDGQSLSYANEQPKVVPMKWPGDDNSGQVDLNLQLFSSAGSGINGISKEGSWGLFRLLDTAKITSRGGTNKFVVVFSVGGKKVTFEIRAGSAFHPFQLKELSLFRCPQKLG